MPKKHKPYDDDDDDEDVVSGPCKNCQFFDVDRDDEEPGDNTVAACLHPDMEDYELSVSGDSGCNLFDLHEEIDLDDDDEDEDDDIDDDDEDEEY